MKSKATNSNPRLTAAERLMRDRVYVESMELLFFGEEGRPGSSARRIREAADKREAVLNERVIDLLTGNLGFGICTLPLHNAGNVTIRDLVARTEDELCKIKYMGPKRVAALKAELADYGFTLKKAQLS